MLALRKQMPDQVMAPRSREFPNEVKTLSTIEPRIFSPWIRLTYDLDQTQVPGIFTPFLDQRFRSLTPVSLDFCLFAL